jgi:hypothetical protein
MGNKGKQAAQTAFARSKKMVLQTQGPFSTYICHRKHIWLKQENVFMPYVGRGEVIHVCLDRSLPSSLMSSCGNGL